MVLGRLEDDHFPKGVYIITTRAGQEQGGMTASWVCRAASKPPVMSAAIHHRSHTGGLIKKSRAFIVNLIDRDQVDLARLFGLASGRRKNKLAEVETIDSPGGLPVLKDALGFMECRVDSQIIVEDHTVFFGWVVAEELFRQGRPLMFSPSDYQGAGRKDD
jgi:flavin reductase (DIM6/NTAB) family NADH-FMN oxidoreductase RutF